jgi:alkanesulfonate monooxygenase SsuD/methylene tetrahydromethanopterin reductase-like flavin-dependent oxidoreductase (luciferase family)
LNRAHRRRRKLHAGNQSGNASIFGGAVQRGDGVAQGHRPAATGEDRQGVKARRLRGHRLQVELEHATAGYPVVAGGVDPVDQGTHVINPGNRRQKTEHVGKPTDRPPYGDGVRFSIAIPQFDSDGFDAAGLRAYLARAEELGFEGGWVLEQTIGQAPLLAPLELLAYCAACTERLRLGVAVLVSSLHDPLQLASAITAVDRLSHGRLDVGVAPGGGGRQFAAFGVDKDTFISYFTEGLQLMKAAWSDEPRVTFHGRFRDVDDLPVQPKPVQRPHPPIWFGGLAPKALARAVRHGDSFLGAGSSTTEAFAGAVKIVRSELAEQDKDPSDPTHFTIGKRVYLMIDDDASKARERVLAGLRRIYGQMRGIDAVPVSGTPDDVARGLREVIDAGAEMLLLNPAGSDVPENREQMERLAAEVIPQLS